MRHLSIVIALLLLPLSATAEDLSNEIKELNWIGFQQLSDVSRVFVRTTEPVKFRVDTSNDRMVVLILENTTVPLRNNRRQLDTRYFDSPVRYIQPKVIEGPSASVRIEILLRDKVPFEQKQEDTYLALEFRRH